MGKKKNPVNIVHKIKMKMGKKNQSCCKTESLSLTDD